MFRDLIDKFTGKAPAGATHVLCREILVADDADCDWELYGVPAGRHWWRACDWQHAWRAAVAAHEDCLRALVEEVLGCPVAMALSGTKIWTSADRRSHTVPIYYITPAGGGR